MKINADLGKRAVMDSTMLDWVASPMAGVERRMLERDGDEVARATSIVRYAPDSAFSAHVHGGGEEFLVLDGVFTDETGDFPTGMYVRNPPGSRHIPSSAPGCTILVKLWQMTPDDTDFVRINTHDRSLWRSGREGEDLLPLYEAANETVQMVRWSAGLDWGTVSFPGGGEYFILEGSFADDDGVYDRGAWLRLPPGSSHTPRTDGGCLFYLKTGHLQKADVTA